MKFMGQLCGQASTQRTSLSRWLVLALSLAGMVVGMALRTRAFLYSGVTFLVLNILGQLIQLVPEQRFGKAIMLLALGLIITGGMIWFNLQRERILQRIRIFRAGLETWAYPVAHRKRVQDPEMNHSRDESNPHAQNH